MTNLAQQIKRVVVPIDDVPEHERAIRIAERIGAELDAEVQVVSVAKPGDQQAVEEALRQRVHARSGTTVRSIAPPSGSIGGVESALTEIGEQPDVIMCMASRGPTSVGEMLLGSVSAWVFRTVHHPVVVVGPHCRDVVSGSILAIAVDGTPEAEAIIPMALTLATALSVRPVLYQAGTIGARVPSDASETSYLHRLAERVVPGSTLDYEALHDTSVEDALSKLAERDDIAMLAITTRSVTALQRLLHGSVASDVVRHAACPVLVQSIW
jgi:nucleotide-binding universal stress UspA family protein